MNNVYYFDQSASVSRQVMSDKEYHGALHENSHNVYYNGKRTSVSFGQDELEDCRDHAGSAHQQGGSHAIELWKDTVDQKT